MKINTNLEVMQFLADGDTPMSKYGKAESIHYLIGYGTGKCLSAQYIAGLIKECAESVNMNEPQEVLNWIIERECD